MTHDDVLYGEAEERVALVTDLVEAARTPEELRGACRQLYDLAVSADSEHLPLRLRTLAVFLLDAGPTDLPTTDLLVRCGPALFRDAHWPAWRVDLVAALARGLAVCAREAE